ncbi:hypothetical protein FJZ53_07295, partial [Candidatus Woesearchaeota archaeon]|nr:hypothetical protein [Candidatus Woesearchaeota archaeon]
MSVIQAKILSLVVVILLVLQVACASNIQIDIDQLTISGIVGESIASSFEVRNTGSSEITNIAFYMTNTLTHSSYSYTIPNSNVMINSGSSINLNAGTSALVNFNVSIPSSTYPGNYVGTITASNSSETDTLVLIVNAQQQDLTPPIVVSHSPTGKVTTSAISLTVVSNEDATCKYSTLSGITYDNMDGSFSSTGSTTHVKSLTGLIDGNYHYYVKCKDTKGNIAMSDYDATFTLDSFPKADITLNPSS